MGCDIHMIVEVRKDGKWEQVSAPKGFSEWGDKNGYDPVWYPGRNYSEFALLAGVRDYQEELNKPIKEPTYELPKDTTLSDEHEDYIFGCHSITYYLLKELLDYDWESKRWCSGTLSAKAYIEQIKEHGRPIAHFSQGSWGPNLITLNKTGSDLKLSTEDLEWLIEEYPRITFSVWTRYWLPAKEMCPYLYENLLPALIKLGDPNDVRVTCWFDN